MRYLYQKNNIVTLEKAAASPFDHGFLYGNGLFETMEVWRGKPVDLPAHIERLRQGAKALGWPQIPLDDVRDELAAELEQKAVAAEIESLTAAAKVEKPGEGIDPTLLKDETLLDK